MICKLTMKLETPKVFIGHSIYKGKAALTVEPRPPEFAPLDSGAFKLTKEGFILLQFAPAAGVRQYDWSRKQCCLDLELCLSTANFAKPTIFVSRESFIGIHFGTWDLGTR
ncbi:single-stranded DNA-binding protein WHY1, chloroplastic-like protein, partial [Tanacetum coccineum]